MKKLAIAVVVFLISIQLFSQNKKYKIKDFMLTYEMETMGMKINTYMYVKNYGEVEVSEVKMNTFGNEIHTRTLTNKEFIYQFDMVKKNGKKVPIAIQNDETKIIDYDNLTKEDKEKRHIKELGTEEILGKSCKIVEMESNGVSMKSWIWKNITLKIIVKQKENTVTMTAIELDTNPDFPLGIFEVPLDFIID